MKSRKHCVAIALSLTLLNHFTTVSHACGPEDLQPVYVFTKSPDPPFEGFVNGNIGIVKNSFGRKTLFIAYRYLQGGSFTGDEQQALIQALKGKPPEENDETVIKAWLQARKEAVTEENLPDIYVNRRWNGGFDFFPNCTSNAFEVAVQTLKDRIARFGKEDPGVGEWLRGQDQVFANCGASASAPTQLGPGSPPWLQKDRDYQIGAALFYQMKFENARTQFEKIADDIDSPWQETARYLVARTLVREASINGTPETQKQLYERAELYLLNQAGRSGQFQNASMKLLGLVKYRLHPEERVRELAQVLAGRPGNENLRQDLIDYTWLLDKFDQEIREAEEIRKKQAEPQSSPTPTYERFRNEEEKREAEAIQAGELIQIWFTPIGGDGQPEYQKNKNFVLPHDVTYAALLAVVEGSLGRKLSPKENEDLKQQHQYALESRSWQMSPNRKWPYNEGYEGCNYPCDQYDFDLTPAFLRLDDLSDWIFTFQSDDPKALQHAKSRWNNTQSVVWLVTALSKAHKTTPGVQRLLAQAETVPSDSPAFPSLAYHRVRLSLQSGRKLEARRLLDHIINTQFDALPISTQNEFLQQRMSLSDSFSEFLRFAMRKPVVFYQYGTYGSIAQIFKIENQFWSAESSQQTKEEFDQEQEAYLAELLPWQERVVFDDETAERMNWHFSTAQMLEASRDPAVPNYLRRQLLLTVWTRSFVLGDETTAIKVASEVGDAFPAMADVLRKYVQATGAKEREHLGLLAILKFPTLTPFVVPGIPEFTTSEKIDYYFESAWWCPLDETDYDDDGNQKPRKVENFGAWNSSSAAADRERSKLKAIGSAKSFLGKHVLTWAKESPDDPRIPEALFIAFKANEGYKYGCESWERDEEILKEAETLLRERYSGSVWTAKLENVER
jgi:hypothetical protein